MSRRRCCCNCWVWEDDFDRTDSTTISPDWNESTGAAKGDWEIKDNKLHEKAGGGGTADAIVFCTHPVPVRSKGEMRIEVEFVDAYVGDIFRVYACCSDEDDLGTAVMVEFELTDVGQWTITIAGSSEPPTVQSAADGQAYVCADAKVKMVKAGMLLTLDEPAWADDVDPKDGRYAALGHDNETAGAWFDNFEVKELRAGSKICVPCVCQCQNTGLPKELVAEIIELELWSGSGDCEFEDCSDLSWDMTWDFNHPSGQGWFGTFECPEVGFGGFSHDFILRCNGDGSPVYDWPGWNIRLSFTYPTDGKTGAICRGFEDSVCADVQPIKEESTCEPLALVYGWFYMHLGTIPPYPICRYKIRLTEKP